jgi:alkylation response protein AidB-like acyl-CoA dehydrogenase
LIKDSTWEDIYIPEEIYGGAKDDARYDKDFIRTEIDPNLDKLDHDPMLGVDVLNKAGELGLVGIAYSTRVWRRRKRFNYVLFRNRSIGLGTWCIGCHWCAYRYWYLSDYLLRNRRATQKIFAKLATGELKQHTVLTEPWSGSDALGAKTKAELSADGTHYVLNGQKMWITNAGFADVFVVFAKIDGDKFTGFIVEKGFEGLSVQERKKRKWELNLRLLVRCFSIT